MFTKKDNYKKLINVALLIVRLGVGLGMLVHGIPKLQMLLEGGKIQFYNFLGLGDTLSLVLAVFAEVLCSVLLILGLFTRWATIPLITTMVTAAFMVHCTDDFQTKEPSLLYLLHYVLLLIAGAGKISVDGILKKEKRV